MNTDGGLKYGELVLIGTNGRMPPLVEAGRKNIFEVYRAEFPTAILPGRIDIEPVQDHTMSPRNPEAREAEIRMEHGDKLITVQCTAVHNKDMVQIGRIFSKKVDYAVDMPFVPENGTTVSRYAARLVITRQPIKELETKEGLDKHYPRLYAAAFDDKDEIFLGQHASTIELNDGEYDGFTTNGVLVLRPASDPSLASFEALKAWKPEWVEVSVGGRLFKTEQSRVAPTSANTMLEENNYLPPMSIIELCGVRLLWRSYLNLEKPMISSKWLKKPLATKNPDTGQDSKIVISCASMKLVALGLPDREFDPAVDKLNEDELEEQPFCYMGCGHVVTRVSDGENVPADRCPVKDCGAEGKLTELQCALEPRFFIDSLPATHCFNPCGHMVPEKTALIWSKVKPPREPSFAICPFCAVQLDASKPYIKLQLSYTDGGGDFY